jgi:predicted nuclease with RNAse H fold
LRCASTRSPKPSGSSSGGSAPTPERRSVGWLGIDVQVSRGLAYALIDVRHKHLASGWLDPSVRSTGVVQLARRLSEAHGARIVVGIDAPRRPLPARRTWKFARSSWIPLGARAKGHGRHCELVVSSLRLANPQWTPPLADAPPWMQLGFRVFRELARAGLETHEVFPSASYHQLRGEDLRFEVSARDLHRRPKDVLDAYVAAVTVAEFSAGRGCEVGGGDGLGTIVLPRPVTYDACRGIDCWPTASRRRMRP